MHEVIFWSKIVFRFNSIFLKRLFDSIQNSQSVHTFQILLSTAGKWTSNVNTAFNTTFSRHRIVFYNILSIWFIFILVIICFIFNKMGKIDLFLMCHLVIKIQINLTHFQYFIFIKLTASWFLSKMLIYLYNLHKHIYFI